MQRVNGYRFYELGQSLRALEDFFPGMTVKDVIFRAAMAQGNLMAFLGGAVVPIKVSKAAGQNVVKSLNSIFPADPGKFDTNKVLQSWETSVIQNAVREFNVVLNAELPSIDMYLIPQKAIYSTSDLIDNAQNIFPESIKKVLANDVLLDIGQGGRCLAFDLPTAAGFHIWRAVEGQLRAYYKLWSKKEAGKENWDPIIKELKQTKADPKTLGVLDQIRELHRNPIMHPEAFLTNDEAIGLLGIAASAITAMVYDQLRQQPPQPTQTNVAPASQSGQGSNAP